MIASVKENESSQSAAAEGAARGKRRLRIVVADDERDQVTTLAAILQDEGHEVREVYRGTEVLRMVRDFDPDVALIDIGMPGMSGYEVARELRQEFGKQRPLLIAVTGWISSPRSRPTPRCPMCRWYLSPVTTRCSSARKRSARRA